MNLIPRNYVEIQAMIGHSFISLFYINENVKIVYFHWQEGDIIAPPPGVSLEGLMLKLKLQYFGYLTQSVDSLEKTLMLGRIGGRRRRGRDEMTGWHHGLDERESE